MSNFDMKLKLLIDKKTRKVLFAEAGKDFVDFLFNLLSLPVGTVIKLLSKNSMVGCLGNLYDSIEKLNDTYMQPNQKKDSLLNPNPTLSHVNVPLLIMPKILPNTKKFYSCTSNHRHISDVINTLCPSCRTPMSYETSFVGQTGDKAKEKAAGDSNSEEGGFVKAVVTYMVMDDLVVMPMSTISSITMLNKFNITQVGSLEEKVVSVKITEGLKLLKASLQSKKVLTSVFLNQ